MTDDYDENFSRAGLPDPRQQEWDRYQLYPWRELLRRHLTYAATVSDVDLYIE